MHLGDFDPNLIQSRSDQIDPFFLWWIKRNPMEVGIIKILFFGTTALGQITGRLLEKFTVLTELDFFNYSTGLSFRIRSNQERLRKFTAAMSKVAYDEKFTVLKENNNLSLCVIFIRKKLAHAPTIRTSTERCVFKRQTQTSAYSSPLFMASIHRVYHV